jgi:hypothetical protein
MLMQRFHRPFSASTELICDDTNCVRTAFQNLIRNTAHDFRAAPSETYQSKVVNRGIIRYPRGFSGADHEHQAIL